MTVYTVRTLSGMRKIQGDRKNFGYRKKIHKFEKNEFDSANEQH
jgi:hypothetical protein